MCNRGCEGLRRGIAKWHSVSLSNSHSLTSPSQPHVTAQTYRPWPVWHWPLATVPINRPLQFKKLPATQTASCSKPILGIACALQICCSVRHWWWTGYINMTINRFFRFSPRSFSIHNSGICGGELSMGQVTVQIIQFSPVRIIAPTLDTRLHVQVFLPEGEAGEDWEH